MTDLAKPIRRRTLNKFGHYDKRIVVIIGPGDTIAMHRAPIGKVFATLAQWHADGERWAKGKK